MIKAGEIEGCLEAILGLIDARSKPLNGSGVFAFQTFACQPVSKKVIAERSPRLGNRGCIFYADYLEELLSRLEKKQRRYLVRCENATNLGAAWQDCGFFALAIPCSQTFVSKFGQH